MNIKIKMNKRKIYIKILLILLIIFLNKNLYAQAEFQLGSPYTAFGIGDLQYSGNLRNESMSILGIGLFGNNVNDLNPAANTNLEFSNISLGFKYSLLNSASSTFNSKISTGNVTGINIGIPFNKKTGWTFFFGFNPLSSINYKISNQVSTGTETYTQTYAGGGGISRINFGMSYKLFKSISLGADYNYCFGNIKKLTFLDFGSQTISNSYIRDENNLSGSYFKTGAVVDIGKLINSKSTNDFTIGFIYQTKLNLKSDVDAIFNTSLGNDTVALVSENIEIPSSYGFGITKKIGSKTIISGDFLKQDWNNFKISGTTQANFGNSYRFGLGMDIVPVPKPDNSFWENLSYRFGGFYEKSYYTVNGNDINYFGLSTGFGVQMNKYNSIDFGISYSIRGKTDNGLIRDQYIKFTAGLNFGELWFIKSRSED
jgi:hypothetical protein